jgi:microsomal epoxide hydrolase
MNAEPFRISMPDSDIADLRERLARTRWPDALEERGWEDGADLGYMRELCAYWRTRFDWRAAERRLNEFPQFKARVDGQDIHFIHRRGNGPNPKPLLITHGWPSSFAEFSKLIPLLADPAAHGGDAADSFDVIAPSMPGYGFSGRPTKGGMSSAAVTALWAKLMKDVLGYEKFFAHGGDIGSGITNRLGRDHADRVTAIHSMAAPFRIDTIRPPLTEAERAWLAYVETWERDEGAYGHQQRTKPQTLAFGLNDSPAGLAAWIVEKWRGWSNCGGDVESVFTKDELLTQASIYWFTQTAGSSVRMYYESAHAPPEKSWRIETPARLFLTREEVDRCPIEYAQRSYANLSYGLAERGGHFLAAEAPDILARDLRDFFRRFR